MNPGLESLDLFENLWERLPPALAAATSLTELSLANDTSLHNIHLCLTTADVNGILCRLPHLRLLRMDVYSMPQHVLDRLSECMPQLQVSEEPPSAPWKQDMRIFF